MRILIDADACPKAIKKILYKVAIRTKTELILVANQFLRVPISPFIKIISKRQFEKIILQANSGWNANFVEYSIPKFGISDYK